MSAQLLLEQLLYDQVVAYTPGMLISVPAWCQVVTNCIELMRPIHFPHLLRHDYRPRRTESFASTSIPVGSFLDQYASAKLQPSHKRVHSLRHPAENSIMGIMGPSCLLPLPLHIPSRNQALAGQKRWIQVIVPSSQTRPLAIGIILTLAQRHYHIVLPLLPPLNHQLQPIFPIQ